MTTWECEHKFKERRLLQCTKCGAVFIEDKTRMGTIIRKRVPL